MLPEKKTVKMTLSQKARETLFGLCRGMYPGELLFDATTLLNKLKEGATTKNVKIPDQLGKLVDVLDYTNFAAFRGELTINEYNIAKNKFINPELKWNAETETHIYKELLTVFEIT